MAKLEIEITADNKGLKKGLNDTDKQLQKTGQSFGKLNEFAVGALSGIAAAFSIGAIVDFGKAVLDTTAKFQKFGAVLSNTLGSESQAQLALSQIKEFASQTPFAVDELTSSFVKLANQGFRPTINELTSLGDLASSTGKSFDQLAEAIIDAQVGEFERLKEFGIRAKKEGENVTFTFKGVETQVKATDSAIRGYVLSLGDAEGVSGAMAKISETLGGKISNFRDNIQQLQLAIGDKTSGIFANSLDWLNSFVEATTRAAKGVAKIREEAQFKQLDKQIKSNKEAVLELAEAYQSLDPAISKQSALAKAISEVSRRFRDAEEGGEAFINQNYTFGELKQINEGFITLAQELFNVSKASGDAVKNLGLIGGLTAQINTLNEQRNLAKDQNEVNLITAKVIALQNQLSLIEEIAKKSSEPISFEQIANIKVSRPEIGGPSPEIAGPTISEGIIPDIQAQIASTTALRDAARGYEEIQLFNIEIATLQERLSGLTSVSESVQETSGILSSAFSSLGTQIASSMNIANNSLRGFITTLLSSTPKIIQAIFKQVAAKKLAEKAEVQSSLNIASAAAVESAAKAAAGLGPIGLAVLPVLIGGALALINSAFGKGGGGTSGVGSGAQSQAFTGSGAFIDPSSMFSNVTFEISGDKLIGVIDRTNDRYAKG